MIEALDWDALFAAAWQARDKAYAPYSGFRVGASLLAGNAVLVVGCNVENAAFPSSQCAEASAIGTLGRVVKR